MKKNVLVKNLVKELSSNNLAIFAGAGLSVGAGYIDWKSLLRDLAEEIDLEVDREEHDLVSLAQYYINEKGGNKSTINDLILNEFSQKAILTDNHRILARLPIDTFWTTNYDPMIERALEDSGKVVDVKHSTDQLPTSIRGRDAVVYKMHGDASDSSNAVLTKDDYEQYSLNRNEFFTALYEEITEILLEVEKAQKQKTIFISGAAEDYAPYSQKEVESFVSSLTQEILKLGYRVVTGFGLGIGSSVISGSVKYLLENRLKIDEDHLVLRPFPQNEEGKRLWTVYREDMISYAGISIFLFGNKLNECNELVPSNGIQEEYDISKNNGNILLPVGGTGYISEKLWNDLTGDSYDNNKVETDSLAPNIKNLDTLEESILAILKGMK